MLRIAGQVARLLGIGLFVIQFDGTIAPECAAPAIGPGRLAVLHAARDERECGLLARHFARLPSKPGLDAYTTMRILNARAQWALDDSKDVIASTDGANWTVCMDREASLKEAVQSRTVFLTEVDSWRDVVPLLSPKVQTVGIALGDPEESLAFAEAATQAGVVRCVRPGIMNNYEFPWDGKLLVGQLVRWVTLKP